MSSQSMSDLQTFLLKARAATYAADKEKSKPLLDGSFQYDFADGDFSYRDVYFLGNGRFPGLETVYFKGKPAWSMSYFGDFSQMSEQQIDSMLRKALIDTKDTTRLYNRVEKEYPDFTYVCEGSGSLDEVEGSEVIKVDGESVYFFYYAGGYLG